ncbi:MAG: hypothetical protein U1E19_09075 [Rhodoblastus sp.]
MKRFRTTLAIAALAFCVSLPAMAKEGRASGESCVSSYARCSQRCTTNVGGDPVDVCRRKHCDSKMSICRQSGCWQQDARFGGEVTCGLK